MRSHRFTVRLPHPVYRVAVLRAKYLGYKNVSEFLTNLVRCDGVLKRDHNLTVWISQLALPAQDFIDDRLERFPPATLGAQPTLTHYFCAGLIAVESVGGRNAAEAIAAMPAPLAHLCAEYGFC